MLCGFPMPWEGPMQILDATADHAEGIAAIYNHAVEHTTAIWNERLVDPADRAAWLAARQEDGFPVLVALEDDGTVLGYATYGPWRPHDGYRHTVEHSLYVREGLRGRGTGSALLTALLERARAQGIHVMIAGIGAEQGLRAPARALRLHPRRRAPGGDKFGAGSASPSSSSCSISAAGRSTSAGS